MRLTSVLWRWNIEELPRRSLDVPPAKYPLPEVIARHVDYLPLLEIRCTLAYTGSQAQTEIRILPISGRGQGRRVVRRRQEKGLETGEPLRARVTSGVRYQGRR